MKYNFLSSVRCGDYHLELCLHFPEIQVFD